MQTTARLSDDGTHWILNGEKKFATNAALAGMMTVMAKTPVTDENGKTKDKVTAFIVTPDLPGFEVVKPNRSKWASAARGRRRCGSTTCTSRPTASSAQLGKGLKVALQRARLRPLHAQRRLRRRREAARWSWPSSAPRTASSSAAASASST